MGGDRKQRQDIVLLAKRETQLRKEMDLLKEKGYVEVQKERQMPLPKSRKTAAQKLEAERRHVQDLNATITRYNYYMAEVELRCDAEMEKQREIIQQLRERVNRQRRIIKRRDEELESQKKELDSLKKQLHTYRRSSC